MNFLHIPRLFRVLAVVGVIVPSALSGLSGPSSRHVLTAAGGPVGVSLVSQSPYVETQGEFHLQIDVNTGGSSGDFLQVLGFPSLVTRTAFQSAAVGKYSNVSPSAYQPIVEMSSLSPDAGGHIDLEVPFNLSNPPAVSGGTLPPFPSYDINSDAVYPFQVALYNSSNQQIGQAVNTFLIYAAGAPPATINQALSVGLVLPVTAAPNIGKSDQVEPLSAKDSATLNSVVSAIASTPGVDITLAVTPQTVQALAAGSSLDQQTLEDLRNLVQGGDEILPATFVRQSVHNFVSSGLDGELTQQLDTGRKVLTSELGQAPESSAWVTNGPIDSATLSALSATGVTRLMVPAADLTASPPTSFGITYAYGSHVSYQGGPNMEVYGADTGLSDDFEKQTSPVLAANQLLAEMAMIETEAPSAARGVAVLPPSGWDESPQFISTLLAGLHGNPMLKGVGVSGLFTSGLVTNNFQQIASPQPFRFPANSLAGGTASTILSDRQGISGLASILPVKNDLAATLQTSLLVSESRDITASQQSDLLYQVHLKAAQVIAKIILPGSSSITLTSTKSELPLTILSSPSLEATVRLTLTSDRLIFQNYTPPHGHCEVTDSTFETCTVELLFENNTLRIPVQSRSSGVFPLVVSMSSPDGSLHLSTSKDTVRSTAVSDVGIIIIVLALLTLAIWWVRDLRHGRRARRLVPSPVETEQNTISVDPVVDAFFAEPPPAPGRESGPGSSRESGWESGPGSGWESGPMSGRPPAPAPAPEEHSGL